MKRIFPLDDLHKGSNADITDIYYDNEAFLASFFFD